MAIYQKGIAQLTQEPYSLKLGGKIVVVSNRTILISIILLAIVLRLVSAIYLGNNVANMPGIYDQISYDGLARRVVDGYGFSFAEDHWPATRGGEPTAHWSFLYTLFLAAVYKVFGFYPIIARVIQAVIVGVFHIWFIFKIGQRMFGTKVGLLTAFLSSIYIYFFYYAGGLVTESFFITGILWTIDASGRLYDGYEQQINQFTKKKLWRHWLELGLAIGVTILFRQTFLLFLPVLFLWLWWNTPGYRTNSFLGFIKLRIANWSVILGMVLSTLILLLMIVPWTIRNYRAFDTFVLLNTNAGFAFFWGNHPIHGSKFIPILPKTYPSYQDLIPQEYLSLNEGKLDRALLQEGIRIVIEDPVRYLILSLTRVEEYFKFWPSKDSALISNISRVGSFGLLLPFMIVGVLGTVSKMRDPTRFQNRQFAILLFLFIGFYSLLHFLSWTLIRYRLPVDSLLIIFSVLGIINIYNCLRYFGKSNL
jgi:hypothetical protein